MVGKFIPASRSDGALLLNLKPLIQDQDQDQGQGVQPTPLEFYGLLMKSSLSAKIVIDSEGAVVDFNPAAEELLGFTRRDDRCEYV